MAFSLKNIIFELFGSYEKNVDTNKDAAGKGTLERYNESLAVDFDVNLLPMISQIRQNVRDIQTMLTKFIPLLETAFGSNLLLDPDLEFRRRLTRYMHRYYEIKGTRRGYEVLLSLLGCTVTITEDYTYYSFDSPVTFDDTNRTFDMSKCDARCSGYTVDVLGALPLTDELEAAIGSIIRFNQPINAVLINATYNGNDIDVFVD